MNRQMITFPVANKQVCSNCKITLGIDKLFNSEIDSTEDAYGMPAIMIRCPFCKTLIEWEMKCN